MFCGAVLLRYSAVLCCCIVLKCCVVSWTAVWCYVIMWGCCVLLLLCVVLLSFVYVVPLCACVVFCCVFTVFCVALLCCVVVLWCAVVLMCHVIVSSRFVYLLISALLRCVVVFLVGCYSAVFLGRVGRCSVALSLRDVWCGIVCFACVLKWRGSVVLYGCVDFLCCMFYCFDVLCTRVLTSGIATEFCCGL